MMLGLGEGRDEIFSVIEDLREAGCSLLTLGQYLQPSKNSLSVERYYHPDEFLKLRDHALSLGFSHVIAGPLVRSSYHAEEAALGNSGSKNDHDEKSAPVFREVHKSS